MHLHSSIIKRKFTFTTLLVMVCLSAFSQVTFKATAPNAVVIGEQFRLTYTINDEGKDIRIGELPDFEILYGPSVSRSSSYSIINGQTTASTSNSFTYTLMGKKEGSFEIPAATIKVGNSEYKSNGLTIKVLPQDKAAENANAGSQSNNQSNQKNTPSAGNGSISSDEVFVRMHISKNSVFENEGFLVTFKLYSLYDISGLESVKFPEFEGFISQEIDLPEERQLNLENYNGRNYRTFVLKQTVLYPQRSGTLTIPAGKVDLVLRVRSQQRVRSIFDDFFESYTNVKKSLTINAGSVNVKPLPAGKPASFSGAVGDYKLNSSITSENVKANDAITIKVDISGSGNIKLIKNPEINFPNDFEIYDPKINLNLKTTTAGVSGSKSIEYLAIPRYAGDFTIPSASFSYFDIKTGTYKTLSTPEYKLHVSKGDGDNSNQQIYSNNYSNKEDLKFLGQDIRYIKTDGFSFSSKGNYLFGKISYILWYIIPALLFIIYFIVNRKQAKENSNIALVRTKKANKVAAKRLKTAGNLLKENKKEEFYDEVLKALWGYLSDKLNIPVASLTKDNVETELTKYGVGEPLIKEFMDILNTCEFARYAPSQDSHGMDKLYDSTVNAIDKMENTIKK